MRCLFWFEIFDFDKCWVYQFRCFISQSIFRTPVAVALIKENEAISINLFVKLTSSSIVLSSLEWFSGKYSSIETNLFFSILRQTWDQIVIKASLICEEQATTFTTRSITIKSSWAIFTVDCGITKETTCTRAIKRTVDIVANGICFNTVVWSIRTFVDIKAIISTSIYIPAKCSDPKTWIAARTSYTITYITSLTGATKVTIGVGTVCTLITVVGAKVTFVDISASNTITCITRFTWALRTIRCASTISIYITVIFEWFVTIVKMLRARSLTINTGTKITIMTWANKSTGSIGTISIDIARVCFTLVDIYANSIVTRKGLNVTLVTMTYIRDTLCFSSRTNGSPTRV